MKNCIPNCLGLVKFNFAKAVFSRFSEMVCRGSANVLIESERRSPLTPSSLSDNVAELDCIFRGQDKDGIACLSGCLLNAFYVVHIICTSWDVCVSSLKTTTPGLITGAVQKYGSPSLRGGKNRFSLPDDEEVIDAIAFWALRFYQDDWIDFMKDTTCWIFAKSENCELPDLKTKYNPRYLCPGSWGMRMYTYANRSGNGSRFWRFTILQGIKKGMPVVSSSFITKSLVGLKQDLEAEKKTPQVILDMITRTSKTIFSDLKFRKYISRSHKLSNSSCYESSRKDCGPLGKFLMDAKTLGLEFHDEPICMTKYHPRFNPKPWWVYSNKDEGLRYLDCLRLQYFTEETHSNSWEVSPLLEPLKVRPITRGPFTSNGLFSDVQKTLWQKMSAYPQMRLTKGSDPGKSLQGVFDSQYESIRDLDQVFGWKSGDFSAATNKLHSDCTKAAISGIPDARIRGLLENNLLEGRICFNEKHRTDKIFDFDMKNGQLMGSMFSFPLLCVINLSIYRLAYELWNQKRSKISELPVLVNGDDILFYCTKSFEKFWSGMVRTAGLIPSKGKDYWSTRFAMVNSTYICTKGKEFGKHIPYFNLGLYSGRKKGDSDLCSDSNSISFRSKLLMLPNYFRDYYKHYDPVYNKQYMGMQRVTLRDRWDVGLVRKDIGLIELGLTLPCKVTSDEEVVYYLENYPEKDLVDDYHRHKNFREYISREKVGKRDLRFSFEHSLFWDLPREAPSYPKERILPYTGKVTDKMEVELNMRLGLCENKSKIFLDLQEEYFSGQGHVPTLKSIWA